tara:strand:+ start:497 stop:2431 length:1935 start_codon:yes stop_codon:yes gene_type:complete
MSTIKINQLATGSVESTSLLVFADANGVAFQGNADKLTSFDSFKVDSTVARKRDARALFPVQFRKKGNKLIYDLDGVTYNEIYVGLRESDYADPLNWINRELELKTIYNLADLDIIAEDRYLNYNSGDLSYTFLTNFSGYSDSGFRAIKPSTTYVSNLATAGNRTILLDANFAITRILGSNTEFIETTSNEVYINYSLTMGQTIASKIAILSALYLLEPKDFNNHFNYTEVNTLDTSKLNLTGVVAIGGTGQVLRPTTTMRDFLSSLNANKVSVQTAYQTLNNEIRESHASDTNGKFIVGSTLIYLPSDNIDDIDVHFYSLLTNSVVQYHIEEFINIQKVSQNTYYVSAGGRADAVTTDEIRFQFSVAQGSHTGSGSTLKLAEIGYLRYDVVDNNSYINFGFNDSFIKENTEVLRPNFYGKPFTKITLFGTSIEEQTYFDEVAEKYGLIEGDNYLNYGYGSGVCVWDTVNGTDANIKSSWSASLAEKQAEAAVRGITLTTKDEEVCYDNSVLNNLDSELFIIGTYGVNSRGSYLPNRFATASEFDRTSIYGSYNYVIQKLLQASPSARVIILGQVDSIGNDLTTVNNIQELVSENWNIYFANWVKVLGVNSESASYYLPDNLHPSQELREVMAKFLIQDLLLRQ